MANTCFSWEDNIGEEVVEEWENSDDEGNIFQFERCQGERECLKKKLALCTLFFLFVGAFVFLLAQFFLSGYSPMTCLQAKRKHLQAQEDEKRKKLMLVIV